MKGTWQEKRERGEFTTITIHSKAVTCLRLDYRQVLSSVFAASALHIAHLGSVCMQVPVLCFSSDHGLRREAGGGDYGTVQSQRALLTGIPFLVG